MSTTRSKTLIEPAVRAQLSYKTEAMIGRTAVTIVGRDGNLTLTRAEFEKLMEAEAEFHTLRVGLRSTGASN